MNTFKKTFGVYALMLVLGVVLLSGCTSNPPPQPPYTPPPSTSNLVNINTAGQAELESLPGIGPVLAEEIINYRFFYGPFRTTHDIVNVNGIGEGKYEQIRGLITCYGGSSSYYHPPSPPPSSTDPYDDGSFNSSNKMNINIATQQELETLPGIGPAKARAIIEYRTRYGNFQRKEDVKNVSGIGDATYAQIEPYIVARGGTVTNAELDLARQRYERAYQKYTSMQTDPYATYTDKRHAYDDYLAAKKEYDRLVTKYMNR